MEKPKEKQPRKKAGRPVTKAMPPRINAPVRDVARAVLRTQPKAK